MNRTRLTDHTEVAGRPGDPVTVLSGFHHPARGPVSCPAAPLLAGWLRERGQECRIAAAGALPAGSGGRLAATTYLDLDGRVVGLAVTAPAHRATLAAEAVRVWSAALRTRRLLVCTAPLGCEPPPSLPTQPDARTADRARGRPTPRTVCPRAVATWATAAQYEARGDTVLLLGTGGPARAGDAETAHRPRVRDVAAAHVVQPADPERLSFVQYPCAPVEEMAEILKVLRRRFPMLRGQHPDEWCYRAADRRLAVRAVARAGDLVLLGARSTEAEWLKPEVRVPFDGLHVLRPELLAKAATIGLLAPLTPLVPLAGDGGRDGTELVAEVLGGLGPLSLVHHRSLTQVRTDVLARTPEPPGRPRR
ncbi:hypothetical protein CFP65_0943 [Kitasatospora sp. MMS16-BH015]|uniref:hypothetical protein n=1 Tax=Kitasatospora sp. MMS16-BH015 TaxID=2018025 RepID=UPI000CA39744|nr:hypothetical protein [Kitasatospora sp. MMS16-BH015]AUG75862.1 hypothetical protein CFP65_0943 [Kitasatospora sp. MMS16-BH015]